MEINGVAEISEADLIDREPIAEVAGQKVYKDSAINLRSNLGTIPPETRKFAKRAAFPDYIDADGDGYPENREVNGKGRRRIAVGFRTGGHAGSSLPVTAGGPGALLFSGYMDQTDLFFRMAAAIGGETAELDRALQLLLRTRPSLAR
jgi:alkaline phosphatase